MLKIVNQCPLVRNMTIDADDVSIGHAVMEELGIDSAFYTIEVSKVTHDGALPSARSRSVHINEVSEIAGQLQVQFLDDGKLIGIDCFSQRDCVALFRLIYGWINLSLPHLKLKESITRRILHR